MTPEEIAERDRLAERGRKACDELGQRIAEHAIAAVAAKHGLTEGEVLYIIRDAPQTESGQLKPLWK